eukprot:1333528-Rhodomonas_salina.1
MAVSNACPIRWWTATGGLLFAPQPLNGDQLQPEPPEWSSGTQKHHAEGFSRGTLWRARDPPRGGG